MNAPTTIAGVDYARLEGLAEMLWTGAQMSETERREASTLLHALYGLAAFRPEDFPKLRGRPPSSRVVVRARAVRTLVERHNVAPMLAIREIAGTKATEHQVEALRAAYRRETWSQLPDDHPLVRDALDALRKAGRLKAAPAVRTKSRA